MEDIKPNVRRVTTQTEIIICTKIIAGSEPWTTLGITSDQVMNTVNNDLNEVYAAYVKDDIVGVIIIQMEGAFSGYLKNIVVKHGWRNKNLGKTMMDFVENKIFSKCTNVFLCVSSFNREAKKFYINIGYQEVGELKNYLVDGYDEILMRKTKGPILGENEGGNK